MAYAFSFFFLVTLDRLFFIKGSGLHYTVARDNYYPVNNLHLCKTTPDSPRLLIVLYTSDIYN